MKTPSRTTRQVIVFIIILIAFGTGILLLFAEPQEEFNVGLFLVVKLFALLLLLVGYSCFKALNSHL